MSGIISNSSVANQTEAVVALAPEIMSLLNHWVRIAFACAGIALGLLVCCLGVRVLKFCVFLMGFCIGAVVGGVIAWRISLDDKATLIAAFSTGAVVGLLCVFIVKFGRFIAAAAVGFLPVFLFIQTGGSKAFGGNVLAWCLLGGAIIFGAIVLYFAKRYIMAVATAYAGALVTAFGVGFFLPGQHVDAVALVNDPAHIHCTQWQCYLLAGAWVVFGTMGLIVQLVMYEKPLSEQEIVEQARLMAESGGRAPPQGSKKWKRQGSDARPRAVPDRMPSYEELVRENRRLKSRLFSFGSKRHHRPEYV